MKVYDHKYPDPSRMVMFVVRAYRKLTDDEVRQYVAAYINGPDGKKLKPSTRVTILTTVGPE